jgi:hypothetical protein
MVLLDVWSLILLRFIIQAAQAIWTDYEDYCGLVQVPRGLHRPRHYSANMSHRNSVVLEDVLKSTSIPSSIASNMESTQWVITPPTQYKLTHLFTRRSSS